MNDLRKLSRILIIAMGIYFLITALIPFFISLPSFLDSDVPGGFLRIFCLYMFYVALIISIIFFLIKKADFWSEKIVGAEEQQTPTPKIFWVPVAFRLAAVFIGLYFIYGFLSDMYSLTVRIIFFKEESGLSLSDYSDVEYIARLSIQLALAIYLLCGAPHFVRWHTKKILKQFYDAKAPVSEVSPPQK